jgi:ferredoxin
MALVTFSSPEYKDKTVYAVAGSHTQTLLKLALENKIQIPFNCEDGNCGTCVVKVSSVDSKPRMSGHLTAKEITVLKQLGKITQQEIDEIAVTDMPATWRLACQFIVRDEDILVEY